MSSEIHKKVRNGLALLNPFCANGSPRLPAAGEELLESLRRDTVQWALRPRPYVDCRKLAFADESPNLLCGDSESLADLVRC